MKIQSGLTVRGMEGHYSMVPVRKLVLNFLLRDYYVLFRYQKNMEKAIQYNTIIMQLVNLLGDLEPLLDEQPLCTSDA
jgi:hypothetical protein